MANEVPFRLYREHWDSVQVTWWNPGRSRHNCVIYLKNEDSADKQRKKIRSNVSRDESRVSFNELQAGASYRVSLKLWVDGLTYTGEEHFRAVFTKDDLRDLLEDAQEQVSEDGYRRSEFIYRDQSKGYFDHVKAEGNKIQTAITPHTHENPESPLKNQLPGTFFSCSVNKHTEEPYTPSMYGPKRLKIPVGYFFGRRRYPNLYLADYFNTGRAWTAVLVMTFPDNDADDFAQENLLELDVEDNIFLSVNEDGDLMVTTDIWVEIFYTKNLHLDDVMRRGGRFETVAYRPHH